MTVVFATPQASNIFLITSSEDFRATPFTPIKPRLIRNQSTLQTFNDLSTTLNNTTVAYSETDVVFMHYPEAELSFSESHSQSGLLFNAFTDQHIEESGNGGDDEFDEYDDTYDNHTQMDDDADATYEPSHHTQVTDGEKSSDNIIKRGHTCCIDQWFRG